MFDCPYCGEKTISIRDKHLLGYWMSVNCKDCGARVGAKPIPLALMYFVHTWNIIWFVTLYVYSSMKGTPDMIYFLYMIIGWIILDIVSLGLIPMGAMKPKKNR